MPRPTVCVLKAMALCLVLIGSPSFAEDATYHDEMASKIEAKRGEIRRHTDAMEAIDDPEALQQEMQKHFRMTEELLGWVVEHQKQRLAAETPPTTPPPEESAATSGGMGHDRMGKGTGSMGEMGHGKKKGPSGSMDMGGMGKRQKGMHGKSGGGHDGMSMGGPSDTTASPTSGASAAAARIAERESLLQEITTHSLYLEGLTDARERARETVRHQQMLDRLMTLMQE